MGKITGASANLFKSAEYIYSKIKREFASFGNANLLDDADFPLYTAEVLKRLGCAVFREEEALLFVKNGKANLPKDFMYLYAAYKCRLENVTKTHLQNKQVVYSDTYYDVLSTADGCKIECDTTNLITRVTIRNYIDETTYTYMDPGLLKLSPNVKAQCSEDCLNLMATTGYEITINNGCIYTNFKDEDIYMKYYAFPFDEEGNIQIPDIVEVEKCVEWWIKFQILLNFWFTNDVTDIQARWGKAEEQYNMWFAEAKYISKLPAFSSMINDIRNMRAINKVSFFSQLDKNR